MKKFLSIAILAILATGCAKQEREPKRAETLYVIVGQEAYPSARQYPNEFISKVFVNEENANAYRQKMFLQNASTYQFEQREFEIDGEWQY
ncbi:MAG: hypothetical protein VW270_09130 [Candidatus Poseidoniales archaeon]